MTFPCTLCGACCRRLSDVHPDYRGGLPLNPDGSCGHLVDNLCAIYAERPDCCRVDVMIASMAGDSAVWRRETARRCNVLQELEGLPERYRVRIP
jgi:Fe-S-cluster containining protein